MKSFLFLPLLVASYQVRDVDVQQHLQSVPDIASMREMLVSYAEKKKEGKIDEASANAITVLLTNINRTIFEALYQDRATAQNFLDNAYDAVESCNTNRTNSLNGEIDGLLTDKLNAFGDLEDCKDNQTNTSGVANETCDEADTICDRMDRIVRGYGRHQCGSGAYGTEAPSATEDSDAVFNWFTCVANFTTHHCDEYEDGHEDCENATNNCEDAEGNHSSQSAICDQEQEDFEDATCSWAAGIERVCDAYDGCYDVAHQEWQQAKISVEEMEILFKAQMQALEQLLCFGGAIIENYTDYDHCEFDTCAECPNMDINYRDPHAKKACAEQPSDDDLPCAENWLDTNYAQSGWSAATGNAMAACKECPSVDSPITTQDPDGSPPTWEWSAKSVRMICALSSSMMSLAISQTETSAKNFCEAALNCAAFTLTDNGMATYFHNCHRPLHPSAARDMWYKVGW